MEIPKFNQNIPDPQNPKSEIASQAASVFLNVKKKKVKIKRKGVKKMAQSIAEIAYDEGETNDPEEYAEEITEYIFSALKKLKKRQN